MTLGNSIKKRNIIMI